MHLHTHMHYSRLSHQQIVHHYISVVPQTVGGEEQTSAAIAHGLKHVPKQRVLGARTGHIHALMGVTVGQQSKAGVRTCNLRVKAVGWYTGPSSFWVNASTHGIHPQTYETSNAPMNIHASHTLGCAAYLVDVLFRVSCHCLLERPVPVTHVYCRA